MGKGKEGFQGDAFDWDAYVKHRPVYGPELYDLVYNYHSDPKRSPKPAWETAYDAGTGIGLVGLEHVKRFNNVILSDAGANYIADAKKFVGDQADISKFRFLTCKVEDDKGEIEPSSVDLMTMAMAIHFTDVSKTLDAAAKLVRPGGTFAAWVYIARFHLINSFPGDAELRAKLNKLCAVYFAALDEHVNTASSASHVFQGLDTLDMDEKKWSNVTRKKWRLDDPDELLALAKTKRTETYVKPSEVLEKHDEDIMIMSGVNIEWIKGYYHSLYPAKVVEDDVFREVEDALSEVGGKCDLGWPVAIVLATRR